MKLVIFDIDGTLLYTGGSGRIAFEKAFETLFGVKDCWQDLIPDGKTDPMIIHEITARTLGRPLNALEEKRLADCYHEYFEIEIQNPPKFEILAGVPELLETLSRRKDVTLGIATGNFEQAAWAKLRRGGLHTFFRFGGFASDHADRVQLTKIAADRGRRLTAHKNASPEIFLVGDTPHDVRAGKSLGIPVIGVATGRTTTGEFLEKLQAEYALEDLSDAQGFIDIIENHNVRM